MDHYYSQKQQSAVRITEFEAVLRGNRTFFQSPSGVFSVGRIDKGSKLLIEKSVISSKSNILDLGCGYGPVGIAIAKSFPESKVVMTDVNERAVQFAKRNIKLNHVNAEIFQSNGFEKIKDKFDTILFNPPQTAGKKLCIDLMTEAKGYLKTHGTLQMVMRHRIGGKDTSEKVNKVYNNLEIIASGSGYRIYSFRKS